MNTLINWFEIPVADYERATRFYEEVFGVSLRHEAMGPMQFGLFPNEEPATGGALCKAEHMQPGPGGSLIYLNGGDDLATPLGRVEAAGGKVVMPKTFLSEKIGSIAIFQDCEGNHIGLHSMG
ncbi:MAG: hypothetical protein COX57_01685 [Alphaproteobacteria bacterium CG_4_10_14_0_2_um_filter_63_37]|nr:MAG: hypothetical protein AUJ55_12150 [Proteobacteria bacterium CG1_02_64_396]PJA25720.1 MAG: hypothetical protein COX57_01685 [Alphaproteobacteria bacterium CG_4_10_14_0_2_um_filter_63_37]